MKSTDIEHAVILEKIDNLTEKSNEIHKALVGNGRPGLIERVNKQAGAIATIKFIIIILVPLLIAIVTIL